MAELWFADEELDDIIANFKESDTNGDGKVTREELKNDMKKNKVPDDQIDSFLEQVDAPACQHFFLNLNMIWFSQMFKSCDGDNDGTISMKEVLAFFEVQKLE